VPLCVTGQDNLIDVNTTNYAEINLTKVLVLQEAFLQKIK
jgi:hypothetical protein